MVGVVIPEDPVNAGKKLSARREAPEPQRAGSVLPSQTAAVAAAQEPFPTLGLPWHDLRGGQVHRAELGRWKFLWRRASASRVLA